MNEKTLSKFIEFLSKYEKFGDKYFLKNYGRRYTEKQLINIFIKKYVSN